mmetsp:Transcript_10284/g.28359  ORF Transcript_10284/g.28359 Transcript_10284/m.28359 type:complete len:99 (-) Transcript_10284:18-314(-)
MRRSQNQQEYIEQKACLRFELAVTVCLTKYGERQKRNDVNKDLYARLSFCNQQCSPARSLRMAEERSNEGSSCWLTQQQQNSLYCLEMLPSLFYFNLQ